MIKIEHVVFIPETSYTIIEQRFLFFFFLLFYLYSDLIIIWRTFKSFISKLILNLNSTYKRYKFIRKLPSLSVNPLNQCKNTSIIIALLKY